MVAFIAGKAFGGGEGERMRFSLAAYAGCELPSILGFALAFMNESPALFMPFALLGILYTAYVYSKSRARA